MFLRQNRLQYHARPERPDPVYAKQLQEVLGGQWGEISVMMTYLFQGWNCRGPAKYRDMIMDIGTEEIGHVEMLATMLARLLETSPVETREDMAKDSAIGASMAGARIEDAIVAGMNPQHVIVTGSGAAPTDSVGYPWTARYTIASGNLLADFRFNVTAESQGRLQVSRLYQLTDDPGVRDMLSFLLARDHAPEPVARRDQGARGRGARDDALPEQLPAGARVQGSFLPVPELLRGRREPAGPLGRGRWTARGRSSTSLGHRLWARCPSLARSTRAFRAHRRSRIRLS
jgi:Manganese containing catalase